MESANPELQKAIDGLTRRTIAVLSLSLVPIFLVIGLHLTFSETGTAKLLLGGKNLVTAVLLFALNRYLKSEKFPHHLAQWAGAVVVLLVLVNALVTMFMRNPIQQTIHIILLLTGTGFAILCWRMYLRLATAVVVSWGILFLQAGPLPGKTGYGIGVFTALIFSAVIQRARLRVASQAEGLRLQNERRTAELEIALAATEQARSELAEALHAVQESELRYRTLFESTEAMICTYSPDGTLLSVNPAVMRRLEYAADEMIGHNIREFIVLGDDSALAGELARVGSGHEVRGLMRVLTRSREERVWLFHAMLISLAGQEPYILGNALDITARVRAEESLRRAHDELEARVRTRTAELVESNQALRHEIATRQQVELALREAVQFTQEIIDNAGEGIAVYDRDLRFKVWNPAMERFSGRKAQDVLGRQAYEVFPHLIEQGIDKLHQRALMGETVSSPDVSARLPDGRIFFGAGNYTPHRNASGEIIGIVAMVHDVTARKKAEEELAAYTAKLISSNRELQDFASIASHDLQEPLRKVQTFGDRLRQRCGGALDEAGLDYLERMCSASARMQELITGLLTYARVTTRAQPFVEVDLAALIRDVLSDLEVRIEQSGGRVEVGELPVIDADPLQMRQLLQNLIGNALKFHKPDLAPLVSISSRAVPGADGQGPWLQIEIADNGIGFDEKYLDRIFTIFHRLHGRQSYEGTGIGLAVVRKIVERHGGSITARSEPEQGATFIITLPTRQNEQEAKADEASVLLSQAGS